MYNNCALIGGIICLADVFLLGADSQTDNPARFVKLCQVRTNDDANESLIGRVSILLVERLPTGRWLFHLLRWSASETCPDLSRFYEENHCEHLHFSSISCSSSKCSSSTL